MRQDASDARRPVIVVPVDETLKTLGHGDKWAQGTWTAGDKMCLHQGIRICQKQPGDAYLIEQVAARQGWGVAFNDDSETTWDMVKQRLVEHREVLPDELESTFGPGWESIVVLVRQAAALKTDQMCRLHTAGDAARAAARAAAWAAGAAGDAARDAAGAAGDAAWALAVRHLIGEHGFTQAHYDQLTAPWRSVFPGFDAAQPPTIQITAYDMATTKPVADMDDTEFDVYTWGPLTDPKGNYQLDLNAS